MKDIRLIHSRYIDKNINDNYLITVDINKQILTLFEDFKIIKKYKLGGYQTLFLKNISKLNQFF